MVDEDIPKEEMETQIGSLLLQLEIEINEMKSLVSGGVACYPRIHIKGLGKQIYPKLDEAWVKTLKAARTS